MFVNMYILYVAYCQTTNYSPRCRLFQQPSSDASSYWWSKGEHECVLPCKDCPFEDANNALTECGVVPRAFHDYKSSPTLNTPSEDRTKVLRSQPIHHRRHSGSAAEVQISFTIQYLSNTQHNL